jgi:hypothetical protein
MNRILGAIPVELRNEHEILFRKFLLYAECKKINMDWKLGLHFLSWALENSFMHYIFLTAEEIIIRSVYRWVNINHRDVGYTWVIVPVYPVHSVQNRFIVGKKSQNPTELPQVFRAKSLIEITCKDKLQYSIFNDYPCSKLEWIKIENDN